MEGLTFKRILSDTTHYGIIWSGKWEKRTDCVIKVVLLNSGVHYDRESEEYISGSDKRPARNGVRKFSKDGEIPYLHTDYARKKAMSVEKFRKEVYMLKEVNALKLAPKLFHHWMDQTSYKAHYGFIVMERMTCTVKDILLERDLSKSEMRRIKSKIAKLHDNGIKHGDMKPSNVGVHLTSSGSIRHIRIIDWAKGEYTSDEEIFARDIRTFAAHVEKNILERR